MAKVSDEEIKSIENSIRDLINRVKVLQEEEDEGATQKVEDDAAEELIEKLEKIAESLGGLGDEAVIE